MSFGYVQLGIALGQKLAGDSNAEKAEALRNEEIDRMLQDRSTKIYKQMNAVYAAQLAGFAGGGTEGSASVLQGIAKEGQSAVRDEAILALEAKRASAYQTEVAKMQSTMKLMGAAASAAGAYGGSQASIDTGTAPMNQNQSSLIVGAANSSY